MNSFKNEWILFECVTGSQLYGTSTPESDLDIRGVCLPDLRTKLDPFSGFEQQEFTGEDKVIYELRKFFQLASDCNPNIVELLFISPTHPACLKWSEKWELLFSNKHLFLSNNARFTFTGYAMSQLKRIKTHKKWLDSPVVQPNRSDFGLDPMPLFAFEKLMAILTSPEEAIVPELREYAKKEIQYKQAADEWKDYKNWMDTRNPKRFALESKYGYDTKHGMHLYRLLGEGIELLTTGNLTFPCKNVDELLEIRNGHVLYDTLLETVGDFQTKIDATESILPKKPDLEKLKDLYYRMLGV